jgi:prolyl-tRNA editing enzyme YbaK/EbsC (Cys-tRNA(Pro) deacylase)
MLSWQLIAAPAASCDSAVGTLQLRGAAIAAGTALAAPTAAAAAVQELCCVPGCIAPVGQHPALPLAPQVLLG